MTDWMKKKAISITKTCGACPEQWEGKLEDGRMFYVRYRHGCGYISVSPGPTDNIEDAVAWGPESEAVILHEWHGLEDGFMVRGELSDALFSAMIDVSGVQL